MGWPTKKQAEAVIRERRAIQDRIIERLGLLRLEEAKKRLCDVCYMPICSLLPLIGQGEDCPYFKPKGVEE